MLEDRYSILLNNSTNPAIIRKTNIISIIMPCPDEQNTDTASQKPPPKNHIKINIIAAIVIDIALKSLIVSSMRLKDISL